MRSITSWSPVYGTFHQNAILVHNARSASDWEGYAEQSPEKSRLNFLSLADARFSICSSDSRSISVFTLGETALGASFVLVEKTLWSSQSSAACESEMGRSGSRTSPVKIAKRERSYISTSPSSYVVRQTLLFDEEDFSHLSSFSPRPMICSPEPLRLNSV